MRTDTGSRKNCSRWPSSGAPPSTRGRPDRPDSGTLAFNLGALADPKLFLYDIEAEAGRLIPKPGNRIVDRADVKVDSVPLDDDEFYVDENYVILHNKFTTAKLVQIHFWIRKDKSND